MIELPMGIWNLTPIGGLVGVIVILYWLLASGRLVPRSTLERIEATNAIVVAAEKKRGDEWKETAIDQRAVNQEIRKQNTLLLEATRTSAHFFSAVTPQVDGEVPRVAP
ncbi:hypothetical protein [Microbacterium sp. KNMS]